MKKMSVKRLTLVAIMSAISGILYCFLKFNIPIFPMFLDINLSMIPIIIVAFMLGPLDSCVIILIRFLIKIILVGSSTAYVGEVADIIICLPTALICGCIYNYSNFKYKELFAFISIPITWIISGVLSNYFINIPFYKGVYGIDAIINLSCDAFKLISFGKIVDINASNFMKYYLVYAVIPFNLLLSLIVIAVTLPVHKRLRMLYDKFDFTKKERKIESDSDEE